MLPLLCFEQWYLCADPKIKPDLSEDTDSPFLQPLPREAGRWAQPSLPEQEQELVLVAHSAQRCPYKGTLAAVGC